MNTEIKDTTALVPIKTITDGVIVLDNNEKVTGIKVFPKNIFILDSATQNMTISNLKNVYNIINYEFWLIVADRPVDINVYVSQLQLLYNETQNPVKKKMIIEDMNKANEFVNDNVVDTEFYILFKERDIDKAQKKIRDLMSAFLTAGLQTAPVSNEDLRVILDNFLNGGITTRFGTVMS